MSRSTRRLASLPSLRRRSASATNRCNAATRSSRLPGRMTKPVTPSDHEVVEPANLCHHEWQSGGAGFDRGDAERLGSAREHEDVTHAKPIPELRTVRTEPVCTVTPAIVWIDDSSRFAVRRCREGGRQRRRAPWRLKSPPTNRIFTGPSALGRRGPQAGVDSRWDHLDPPRIDPVVGRQRVGNPLRPRCVGCGAVAELASAQRPARRQCSTAPDAQGQRITCSRRRSRSPGA